MMLHPSGLGLCALGSSNGGLGNGSDSQGAPKLAFLFIQAPPQASALESSHCYAVQDPSFPVGCFPLCYFCRTLSIGSITEEDEDTNISSPESDRLPPHLLPIFHCYTLCEGRESDLLLTGPCLVSARL